MEIVGQFPWIWKIVDYWEHHPFSSSWTKLIIGTNDLTKFLEYIRLEKKVDTDPNGAGIWLYQSSHKMTLCEKVAVEGSSRNIAAALLANIREEVDDIAFAYHNLPFDALHIFSLPRFAASYVIEIIRKEARFQG